MTNVQNRRKQNIYKAKYANSIWKNMQCTGLRGGVLLEWTCEIWSNQLDPRTLRGFLIFGVNHVAGKWPTAEPSSVPKTFQENYIRRDKR